MYVQRLGFYKHLLWLNGTCLPLSGQLGLLLAGYTHIISTHFNTLIPNWSLTRVLFHMTVHLVLLTLYQCSFKFQEKVWYILEI